MQEADVMFMYEMEGPQPLASFTPGTVGTGTLSPCSGWHD